MFRRWIEQLSRDSYFRRRLPTAFDRVPIYVSPDSQLKYMRLSSDAFDAGLLAVATDFLKPDFNMWDIGANVGVFTFAAATRIKKGKVLAVEADIWLAQLIQKSLSLNRERGFDITVLPAAVSDQLGVARFIIAARGRASNSLRSVRDSRSMGGVREEQTVSTLTLDVLLDNLFKPDFIKIDVEGAEKMVLDGAHKVLGEIRPMLYIEVSPDNCDAVTETLKSYKYRLVDGESRSPVEKCSFNTIAFPA
jgi:FkbM family methyltransferase